MLPDTQVTPILSDLAQLRMLLPDYSLITRTLDSLCEILLAHVTFNAEEVNNESSARLSRSNRTPQPI